MPGVCEQWQGSRCGWGKEGERGRAGGEAMRDQMIKAIQKLWGFSITVDGTEALGRFCAEKCHD